MFVDSHCHLSFPELREQLPQIRQAMADGGVERALCICTTLEEFETVHGLAMAHDNFWCSVGVHPDQEDVREPGLNDLLARARLPRVVAIGETGLDYYRLGDRTVAQMQWQRDRFAVHIQAARCSGLPLVIHTRSAWDDTFDVLDQVGTPSRTVFHCFTGGPDEAAAALDRGALLSISGIVTFPSAPELREAVAATPLDRLMVETDSPYLAPVPHRGRRNQPAWVVHVGATIAELHGVPVAEVARATTSTAMAFYGLGPDGSDQRPDGGSTDGSD